MKISEAQELVRVFHREKLTDPDILVQFVKLTEELGELADALLSENRAGIADALTDMTYVIFGLANQHGMDLETLFPAVHESNMTKLAARRNPVKGPGYVGPKL